jgi:hypothetical protein
LLELARNRFNDYSPLLQLHRYDEARTLLISCREVFERENSVDSLGGVLSALANLEDELGRPGDARRFEEAALRFRYVSGDPEGAAVSHSNTARYIIRSRGEWREALAHRLAATLNRVLAHSGRAEQRLTALAHDLHQAGPAGRAALPTDFGALCATVEQIEGVRFREMVDRLAANRVTGDELLKQVLAVVETGSKTGEADDEG